MHGGVGTVVILFAVTIWDIVGNHGALGRAVIEAFARFGRSLGML